jgi:hypothetical protein
MSDPAAARPPLPSRHRFVPVLALTALLAACVWSRLSAPFASLLLLAPLLGSVEAGRPRALVAAGYSCGCLPGLVPTLVAVLGGAPFAVVGVALVWVVLTALPWLCARGRTACGEFAGTVFALGLTTLPPLGAVDPFTPALGATSWATGLGAWGLAAYTLLFSALLVGFARPGSRSLKIAAGVIALGLVVATGQRPPRAPVSAAVGFSGSFGPEPRSLPAQRQRVALLGRLLARAHVRDPEARLYVFPEFFLGRFDRGVARWIEPWAHRLAERHAEAVAGAAVAIAERSGRIRWTDGAVAFGEIRALIVTRQPAPLAEWRPWGGASFPAFWWPWSAPPAGLRLGTFTLPFRGGVRRRLAVAVCYAQTLAWTWLWNTWGRTPVLAAAPESFLWTRSHEPRRLENRLVRAWSRLFAVPVVVARSLPPSAPRAVRDFPSPSPTREYGKTAPRNETVAAPRAAVRARHPSVGFDGDIDKVGRPAVVAGHHARNPLVDVAQKLPQTLDGRRPNAKLTAATKMQLIGAEKGFEIGGIPHPSERGPRRPVEEAGFEPPVAPDLPPRHRLGSPFPRARRAADDVAVDTADRTRTESGQKTLDERGTSTQRAQPFGLAQHGQAKTGLALAKNMGRHNQKTPY